ncbi:stage II sporulation protein M [Halopenitus sp. POP-27]|uniref:stage II sporulation protein M n=1 Tax=Halopenitus sp. POP-27 TaxID=2994425 RepID=UPI0024693A1C|nr:stage II sporulation protein M [Halopenitus sp. POP-27]
MDLSSALTNAVAVYRRRPADLLPFYVLGAAIPVITRALVAAVLAVAYVYLEVTGRIARVRTALSETDLGSMPDPEADPAAFQQWTDSLGDVLLPLADPVVLAALVAAGVATVVLTVLLSAGVSAGQYAVSLARLRDERGTLAGIGGVRSYWPSILGLSLLEVGIWLAATFGAAIAITAASIVNPILGVLAALAALLGWTVIVICTRAVFAFAPVAVVVDDVGALGGVDAGLAYVRSNPGDALGYYAVTIATLVAVTSAGSVLAFFEAPSSLGLATLLVVAPGLDLVKTGLFGRWRGTIAPPAPPTRSLRASISAGIGGSWRALTGFVRSTPLTHGLVVAIAGASFALGWIAAGPFEEMVTASIAARLEGHLPPAAALEFFANNWTVALGTAFAGVVLAVPTVVAIWFNGFVFGIVFRLEADLLELVGFVVPHGLLEIPALVIAGAVGLHLGRSGWRTWRGTAPRIALADDLERAFRVLVGVGILLLVAALIEGFVSPYYFEFVRPVVEPVVADALA